LSSAGWAAAESLDFPQVAATRSAPCGDLSREISAALQGIRFREQGAIAPQGISAEAAFAELSIEAPDLLDLTGFDVGEIDVIIDGKDDADPADDEIPPAPTEPVTRTGDIWLCGPHRIGCGDAKVRTFVCQVVPKRVAAAFMDPPFNVKVANIGGRGRIKHREFAEASGEMTDLAFIAFLTEVLGSAVEVSAPGAVHFVVMDHGHLDQLFVAGEAVYDKRLNLCVWKKTNPGQGSLYRSHHELIAVYRVASAPHRNNVELGTRR
jgi:hypothetical protein